MLVIMMIVCNTDMSIEQGTMLLLSRRRITVGEMYCYDHSGKMLQATQLQPMAQLTLHEYLLVFSSIPVCGSALSADFDYRTKGYVFRNQRCQAPEYIAANLSAIVTTIRIFQNLQLRIQLIDPDTSQPSLYNDQQQLKQLIDLVLLLQDSQQIRDFRELLIKYTVQSSFDDYIGSFAKLLKPFDPYIKYLMHSLIKIQFIRDFPELLTIKSTDIILQATLQVKYYNAYYTVIDNKTDFQRILKILDTNFTQVSLGFLQVDSNYFIPLGWTGFNNQKELFLQKTYEGGAFSFYPSLQKQLIYEVAAICIDLIIKYNDQVTKPRSGLAQYNNQVIYSVYDLLFQNFDDKFYTQCYCLHENQQSKTVNVSIKSLKQQETDIQITYQFLSITDATNITYCYLYTLYQFDYTYIDIKLQLQVNLSAHVEQICKQISVYNILDNRYLTVQITKPGVPQYNLTIYAKTTNQLIEIKIDQQIEFSEVYDLKQIIYGDILIFEQIQGVHINIAKLSVQRPQIDHLLEALSTYKIIQYSKNNSTQNSDKTTKSNESDISEEEKKLINEQMQEINQQYLKIYIPIAVTIFLFSLMTTTILMIVLHLKYKNYNIFIKKQSKK